MSLKRPTACGTARDVCERGHSATVPGDRRGCSGLLRAKGVSAQWPRSCPPRVRSWHRLAGPLSITVLDTTSDPGAYRAFYERLGADYPEAEVNRAANWARAGHRETVIRELRPFARRDARLVDVGCGNGEITNAYCEIGGSAVGLDLAPALIEKARVNAHPNSTFRAADVEELDRASFDVALCSEVLEHVQHPDRLLGSLHRVLKPGGTLILTTPTPMSEIVPLSRDYVREVWRGDRLSESQVVSTDENPVGRYGMGGFLYRHDGYYPLALARWVESFGFSRRRVYTVYMPLPTRLRKHERLRVALESSLQRLPRLRLLGGDNVQVHRRA